MSCWAWRWFVVRLHHSPQERLTVDDAVELALKGNFASSPSRNAPIGSHDVALSRGARLLPGGAPVRGVPALGLPVRHRLHDVRRRLPDEPDAVRGAQDRHQQLRRGGEPAARRASCTPASTTRRSARTPRRATPASRCREAAGGADGAHGLPAVLRGARARADRRLVGGRAGRAGHGRPGAPQGRRHHQRRSPARAGGAGQRAAAADRGAHAQGVVAHRRTCSTPSGCPPTPTSSWSSRRRCWRWSAQPLPDLGAATRDAETKRPEVKQAG